MIAVEQSPTAPAATLWAVVCQFRSGTSMRPRPAASCSCSLSSPAACMVSCAVWWTMPTTFGTVHVFTTGAGAGGGGAGASVVVVTTGVAGVVVVVGGATVDGDEVTVVGAGVVLVNGEPADVR